MPPAPNPLWTHGDPEVTWTDAADATASVTDLMAVDDMPEATVRVERWKQAVRLKGPNLPQQVAIIQQSRKKDLLTNTIVRDQPKFVALTLQHCMVSPRLDGAQAKLLTESKNPVILNALVDFCWEQLLNISLDELAAIVADVSGTPIAGSDDDTRDPDSDLPV